MLKDLSTAIIKRVKQIRIHIISSNKSNGL